MRANHWAILLAVLGVGCGSGQKDVEVTPVESALMLPDVVEFTESERTTLRDLGIVLYRNRLILDAQPPITDAQLAAVEEQVDGKVPPELLALWKTSFGGELDYDYEVVFGDHLYSASLRELFYPESRHYRDLNGWIEHELELGQESAEEQGLPLPQRIPFIPFGGFEYLERFYVSLRPNEYGTVLVYAQGIPWKGRLNANSVASVASSVAELFDQLALDEDPFDEESREYASGRDMVQRIQEIEADHPELARKLREIVRASIFDWRAAVEATDFARPLPPRQLKALRLALEFAINRRDENLIDRLHKMGAPFNVTLKGTGGVLTDAMTAQAFGIVQRLLDLKVDVGSAPIIHANDCSDELLLKLIAYGARFDVEAVYSAAETGATEGAIALVNSDQLAGPLTAIRVAASAEDRAARHEDDALKVETGKLGSYLTADEYRERARALRGLAARLRSK